MALPQGTPIHVGSKPTSSPGSKEPLVIVILDWYAAHISNEVRDILHKKGCMRLLLGGGLTSIVQVNDTHLHKPLNAITRALEVRDAARKAELRPRAMPDKSRQSHLDRASSAWLQANHECYANGYKHNGITTSLHGDEDAELNGVCAELWKELQMDTWRLRCLQVGGATLTEEPRRPSSEVLRGRHSGSGLMAPLRCAWAGR